MFCENATIVGINVTECDITLDPLLSIQNPSRNREYGSGLERFHFQGKKKKHRPSDSARLTEPGNACSQLLSEILNHWSELWRFQVLLKTLLQLVLITSSNVTTRGDEEGSLLAVSIFFCQLRHRCEDEHVRVSSTHSNTNRKEFGRLHYRQLHRKPARWRIYRNILVYHLLQIIIEVIVHVYNKMNNSIERFLQI